MLSFVQSTALGKDDETTVYLLKAESRLIVVGKSHLVPRLASNIAKKVEELEITLEKAHKDITKRLRILDDDTLLVGRVALFKHVLPNMSPDVIVTFEDDIILFSVSLPYYEQTTL